MQECGRAMVFIRLWKLHLINGAWLAPKPSSTTLSSSPQLYLFALQLLHFPLRSPILHSFISSQVTASLFQLHFAPRSFHLNCNLYRDKSPIDANPRTYARSRCVQKDLDHDSNGLHYHLYLVLTLTLSRLHRLWNPQPHIYYKSCLPTTTMPICTTTTDPIRPRALLCSFETPYCPVTILILPPSTRQC